MFMHLLDICDSAFLIECGKSVTTFSVNQLQTSMKAQIEVGVIVACRTVL